MTQSISVSSMTPHPLWNDPLPRDHYIVLPELLTLTDNRTILRHGKRNIPAGCINVLRPNFPTEAAARLGRMSSTNSLRPTLRWTTKKKKALRQIHKHRNTEIGAITTKEVRNALKVAKSHWPQGDFIYLTDHAEHVHDDNGNPQHLEDRTDNLYSKTWESEWPMKFVPTYIAVILPF